MTASDNNFRNFMTQKSTPSAQKSLYKKLLKSDVSKLHLFPVEQNANGNIVARLAPEQLGNVSSVRCFLIPYFEGGDETVGLTDEGALISTSSDDLKVDWETGTVIENFQPVYPTIDGHRINMELSIAGRGYNVYEVPIILNAERTLKNGKTETTVTINGERTLQIGYNFSDKQYFIIGIGANIEYGMVTNKPFRLQEGDKITPQFIAILPEDSLDADEEGVRYTDPTTGKTAIFKITQGETFTYNKNSKISFNPIRNGKYVYLFQFGAPNGTGAISWPATIEIENGTVTKTIPEPEELLESIDETDEAA